VGEFPELQGIMGAKYLLAEGEGREVALAVWEHYLPRGAGDSLPDTPPGALLALADRLELLLSIFSRGDRPTGSSDPYGLRRAANGVLQVIWHQQWPINLQKILERLSREWELMFPDLNVDSIVLSEILIEYFKQRWISLMEDDSLDPDIAQAIAGSVNSRSSILFDPCEARERAGFLQTLRNEGRLLAIQSLVQRASRLADKGELGRDVLRAGTFVDPSLFVSQSEAAMFEVIEALSSVAESKGKYRELATCLQNSRQALGAFFDGSDSVLVMCDDLSLRRNRLNLLSVLRNQAFCLADFTKLEN
ncbi:MAG: glycine--tRNA ligase subunit beta, partial [Cyanobacteriota bacterium]|nr:glycine--tRNA ligase subunit beta [Cyanobacteriota bacterium]